MIQAKQLLPLTLVVAALASGYYSQDIVALFRPAAKPIDLNQYCQLSSQTCHQQGVEVRMEHDNAHPLKPTRIFVHWPAQTQTKLDMQLDGLEMAMNTLRFQLSATENGHYEGVFLLPVCTLEAMTWVGNISDGKQQIKVAIRMER